MKKATRNKRKVGNRCKYSIGFSRPPKWEREVWMDGLSEHAAMTVLHVLAPFQKDGHISVQNESTKRRIKL